MVTITSESDCGKKGGALACLGSEVEATIVTSTFLTQMMQDAHLHLDKAIVTTTPSPPQPPSALSTQNWEKGWPWTHPLPKVILPLSIRNTSCLV